VPHAIRPRIHAEAASLPASAKLEGARTRSSRMEPVEPNGAPSLIAYHGSPKPAMRIVPASKARGWMSGVGKFSKRCLPLTVANQAGWLLLNTHRFSAVWDGGDQTSAVQVEYEDTPMRPPARSDFGLGVLTWGVPYLFRTSEGYNLLARGPSNTPKDGIAPLEGLVETDWSVATFTMNWKFTRPNVAVTFEVDEPFCMVVPQPRGNLEAFRPVIRPLSANQELYEETKLWSQSRHEQQVRKFLAEYVPGRKTDRQSWQKHYFKGVTPSGKPAPEHQTDLQLLQFEEDPGIARDA
jgi:hypothetical protein